MNDEGRMTLTTKAEKVVLSMEKRELNRADYRALSDLARSLNIHVVEADRLDMRRGIRFLHDGSEWIAVDSSLSVNEKVRTLGFLLKNERADIETRAALISDVAAKSSTMSPVLTLCC